MQTPIRKKRPNFRIHYFAPPNAAPAQCRPERTFPFASPFPAATGHLASIFDFSGLCVALDGNETTYQTKVESERSSQCRLWVSTDRLASSCTCTAVSHNRCTRSSSEIMDPRMFSLPILCFSIPSFLFFPSCLSFPPSDRFQIQLYGA